MEVKFLKKTLALGCPQRVYLKLETGNDRGTSEH
jgi:hypothetical protein